jgi:hypothetical protein
MLEEDAPRGESLPSKYGIPNVDSQKMMQTVLKI